MGGVDPPPPKSLVYALGGGSTPSLGRSLGVSLGAHGDAKGKAAAAAALHNLGCGNDKHKTSIAEAGAIEPLVRLVSDGDAKGKEAAAWALLNALLVAHIVDAKEKESARIGGKRCDANSNPNPNLSWDPSL